MKCGFLLRKLAMVVFAIMPAVVVQAHAQFKTLYVFKGGPDGAQPTDRLVIDSSGNVYGTTIAGGRVDNNCEGVQKSGCGTVFKISPLANGGWEKNIIYRFTGGTDGGNPGGPLAMDAAGNLYGTSSGAIFVLSPQASGVWQLTTLHIFNGSDGFEPLGITMGQDGNLFGITRSGGDGAGVVYEFSPSAGGGWVFTVLKTFSTSGGGGMYPQSAPFLDGSGNVFGSTGWGGSSDVACKNFGQFGGCGTVFELSPTVGGGWTFNTFALPNLKKGFAPHGILVADSGGDVFGTAL